MSNQDTTFTYYNDTAAPVVLRFVVEAYSSSDRGNVVLDITNEPAADGYVCADAIDVSAVSTWSGPLADYANRWTGGSGCGGGSGSEIWFTATVAAGNLFTFEQTGTPDIEIKRVSGCGTTTCSGSWDEPKRFTYYNDTASPVVLYLVVEGYYSYTTGTVVLQISNGPPIAGYVCTNAIDMTSATTWSGNFSSYANLWTGGTGCSCGGSGAEIWFRATVPNGNTFTIRETGFSTDIVWKRVSACGSTTCSACRDTNDDYTFTNGTGASVDVVLLMETWSPPGSAVSVTASNAP